MPVPDGIANSVSNSKPIAFKVPASKSATLFVLNNGSPPGTLDFSKAGKIKNSSNRILNIDIYDGTVRLDNDLNQLTVNQIGIHHDRLSNLLWSVAGHTIDTDIVMNDNSLTGIDTITFTDINGTIAGIENQNLVDKTAVETIADVWTHNADLKLIAGKKLIFDGA